MAEIDLVWSDGCPNAPEARKNLAEALDRVGLPHEWNEWRIGDPDVPERANGFGSPTVLVEGKDIAGTVSGGDEGT